MTFAYSVLPREREKVSKRFPLWDASLFKALQGFLIGREDASYKEVADKLNLCLGALKTVIHRLRGRFRALLREEVTRTVAKPTAVDEELRYLREALKG